MSLTDLHEEKMGASPLKRNKVRTDAKMRMINEEPLGYHQLFAACVSGGASLGHIKSGINVVCTLKILVSFSQPLNVHDQESLTQIWKTSSLLKGQQNTKRLEVTSDNRDFLGERRATSTISNHSSWYVLAMMKHSQARMIAPDVSSSKYFPRSRQTLGSCKCIEISNAVVRIVQNRNIMPYIMLVTRSQEMITHDAPATWSQSPSSNHSKGNATWQSHLQQPK